MDGVEGPAEDAQSQSTPTPTPTPTPGPIGYYLAPEVRAGYSGTGVVISIIQSDISSPDDVRYPVLNLPPGSSPFSITLHGLPDSPAADVGARTSGGVWSSGVNTSCGWLHALNGFRSTIPAGGSLVLGAVPQVQSQGAFSCGLEIRVGQLPSPSSDLWDSGAQIYTWISVVDLHWSCSVPNC